MGKKTTKALRVWLNSDPSLGAYAIVDWEDKNYIELKIADCNRAVTLDFSYNDRPGKRKALFKLNKLVQVLEILKEKIENDG